MAPDMIDAMNLPRVAHPHTAVSCGCRCLGRSQIGHSVSFRIVGTYLEACNSDAICPCRRIDGVSLERSTWVCFGALSWRVDRGHAQGVDSPAAERS